MSGKPQHEDRLFELLACETEEGAEARAPSRLKAKLYSALLRQQQESGPLRSLRATRAEGYGLCVFEDWWQRTAAGEEAQCFNCCKLCHARVLAEHWEDPPTYWANCPYVAFGRK